MQRFSISSNGRLQTGTFMVLCAVVATFLILPLGLFAFEIQRIHLSRSELANATDAAVLAAMSVMVDDATGQADRQQLARQVALNILRRNFVLNTSLQSAQLSASVLTDTPAAGQCSFDLVFQQDGVVTAHSVFGLSPAFGQFLGLGVVPIRAQSSAGGRLRGDVVLVLDVSDSMGLTSKTIRGVRQRDASGAITYSSGGNLSSTGARHAAFPLAGPQRIPNPAFADFTRGSLLAPLANAPLEVKIGALMEAKAGNLESAQAFEAAGLNNSPLAGLITPQPGFQDDYQRIALAAIQPFEDEKQAVKRFLDKLAGSDVHVGLVTFAPRASGPNDAQNSFSTRTNFVLPHVNLSQGADRIDDVPAALATCPTFGRTATAAGLKAGRLMLEGPGHRPGVQRTIILLTDGEPTEPADRPGEAARIQADLIGKSGIRLYTVGFFGDAQTLRAGSAFLNSVVSRAGNGARAFVAPRTPDLEDVLGQIAAQGNGVALINN